MVVDGCRCRSRYQDHEERRQNEVQENQNRRADELHGLHGEADVDFIQFIIQALQGFCYNFMFQYKHSK